MERPQVNSAEDAYEILINQWDKNTIELREEFKVLLLNRGNKVLGIVPISTGGVSGTVVDAKLVFASALLANASSIILAHNHPSGQLKASQQDVQLTRKLYQAGKLLDIVVYDHIILTSESHLSMSNEGLIT